MSKLHVTQIAGYLEKNLAGKIDLTDYAHHANEGERKKAFLTRSLAALAVSQLTNIDIENLASSITDGSNDGGVDLIFFNEADKTLYVVQTKWHEDGNGSIAHGDVLKFISGVRKIIDLNINGFNDRVKSRVDDIKRAVFDANSKIVLVVAHTGSDDLSEVVQSELSDYVKQQNDTSEIMSLEVLSQSALHRAVSAGLSGSPIHIDVQLMNWGQLREPHKAVYGRVFASDVSAWYQSNGSKLFEKNLRQFLPASSVNKDLVDTLIQRPGEFWYFNNGITAIARTLDKKLIGGNQTDTGTWECGGFSVVNGAQTVGSIHAANQINPEAIASATVAVRIIQISEADDAFGLDVTRNTNTQNSVEKRDFVALDPEQERLRQELRFENIDYAYKSGAAKSDPKRYFDLTEATIALSCSNSDVALAVQAKREISRLWDDIHKYPYKSIFNSSLSGPQLWQLVQISRHVDDRINALNYNMEGRESLICVHGNRFIHWRASRRLNVDKNTKYDDIKNNINDNVDIACAEVINFVQEFFSDSYPASLFKNQSKCKFMADSL